VSEEIEIILEGIDAEAPAAPPRRAPRRLLGAAALMGIIAVALAKTRHEPAPPEVDLCADFMSARGPARLRLAPSIPEGESCYPLAAALLAPAPAPPTLEETLEALAPPPPPPQAPGWVSTGFASGLLQEAVKGEAEVEASPLEEVTERVVQAVEELRQLLRAGHYEEVQARANQEMAARFGDDADAFIGAERVRTAASWVGVCHVRLERASVDEDPYDAAQVMNDCMKYVAPEGALSRRHRQLAGALSVHLGELGSDIVAAGDQDRLALARISLETAEAWEPGAWTRELSDLEARARRGLVDAQRAPAADRQRALAEVLAWAPEGGPTSLQITGMLDEAI